MIYRVRHNIWYNEARVPAGTIIVQGPGQALPDKVLARMAEGRHVVPISTPPLATLPPPWPERAQRLLKAGIVTVEDLLTSALRPAAKAAGTRQAIVKEWQAEAEAFLAIPQQC